VSKSIGKSVRKRELAWGWVYIGIIYRSRAFIRDGRIDVKSSNDLRRWFAKATASPRLRNFGTRVVTTGCPFSPSIDVYRRFDEFSNFPTKFGQIRPNEHNVGRPKFMRGINSLLCALSCFSLSPPSPLPSSFQRGLRAHLGTSTGGRGSRGDWASLVARAFVCRTGVVRVRWIQSSVNCLAARPAILSGLDYKVFHSELIAPRHLRAVGRVAVTSRERTCPLPAIFSDKPGVSLFL